MPARKDYQRHWKKGNFRLTEAWSISLSLICRQDHGLPFRAFRPSRSAVTFEGSQSIEMRVQLSEACVE